MKILSKLPALFTLSGVCYGSFNLFIPSVNVIGADSLNDAMNMMADYGFTRTLIVTDNMLTKLGMAGDVQKHWKNAIFLALFMMAPNPTPPRKTSPQV